MLVEFGVVRICGALYYFVVRYVLLVVRCRCVLLFVAYLSWLLLCVDSCWMLFMVLFGAIYGVVGR